MFARSDSEEKGLGVYGRMKWWLLIENKRVGVECLDSGHVFYFWLIGCHHFSVLEYEGSGGII